MPQFQLGSSTSSHVRASTTPAPVTRSKTPEAPIPLAVFKARTPDSSRRRLSKQPAHEHFPRSQRASFQPLQDAFEPMDQDHLRASTSTSSTVGIKRRAPDDFEDCDGVPAQVFTVDSVPSSSGDPIGQTPRVRRALQSTRAGFTPVRHTRASTQPQPSAQASSNPLSSSTASSATRMPVAMPAPPGSPPRVKSTIADVTNSPRSKAAQKSKRGWLGALRGGASQAARSGTTPSGRPTLDRVQNAAR